MVNMVPQTVFGRDQSFMVLPAQPMTPAPDAFGAALAARTVRNFSTPLPRGQRPAAATARGQYLAQSTPVPVFVRARRTPQCPPLRYTSAAISPD